MFGELNRSIREEVVALLYHAEVTSEDGSLPAEPEPAAGGLSYEHESLAGSQAMLAAGSSTAGAGFASSGGVATPVAPAPKVNSEYENVGRNDLCPCGSGKKFKRCHGA
jgi:preprotein translocase subunit SecA